MKYLKADQKGVRIELHVSPNGKKSEFLGEYNQRLKLKIHAPPVDGKANVEIVNFLAQSFGLPKKSIILLQGESSKQKSVLLVDANLEQIKKILSKLF